MTTPMHEFHPAPPPHEQWMHGRKRRPKTKVSGASWLSPAEAMSMRDEMLADDPWTDEQRHGLESYSFSAYQPMNDILRQRRDATELMSDRERSDYDAKIREANAAMRPTPKPVKVVRYSSLRGLGAGDMQWPDGLKVLEGKTLHDAGFFSTSMSQDYTAQRLGALGGARLEIDVPAGTRAAYLDGDVGFEDEHELVLAPGAKLRITGVDLPADGGRPVVRAEVLP